MYRSYRNLYDTAVAASRSSLSAACIYDQGLPNSGCAGWTQVFGHECLTAPLLNRLTVPPWARLPSPGLGQRYVLCTLPAALTTKWFPFRLTKTNGSIGANCDIGDRCFIEARVIIGNDVTSKHGNVIWEEVILGDSVFVGPHAFPQMIVTPDLHDFPSFEIH